MTQTHRQTDPDPVAGTSPDLDKTAAAIDPAAAVETPEDTPRAGSVARPAEPNQVTPAPTVTDPPTDQQVHADVDGEGHSTEGPQVIAESALADQLEAAAAALRAGIALGCSDPTAVTVSADGLCTMQLPTTAILEWGRLYDRRPQIDTVGGTAYLHTLGVVGAQQWSLHNGEPLPEDPQPWPGLAELAPPAWIDPADVERETAESAA